MGDAEAPQARSCQLRRNVSMISPKWRWPEHLDTKKSTACRASGGMLSLPETRITGSAGRTRFRDFLLMNY